MSVIITYNPCWSKEKDAPMTDEICNQSCHRKHRDWTKPDWFGPWSENDPDNCKSIIPKREFNLNKYLR